MGPLAGYAAGGWILGFTSHYESGTPLTVTDTNGTPMPIGSPVTAGGIHDRLGDQLDPKTGLPLNPFFSRDVWTHIANFRVSPEPPLWSWLRGPSQWVQTATMTKTVSLTERWKAELRLQVAARSTIRYFRIRARISPARPSFGVITGTRSSGTRTMTFGAKLKF